MPPGASSLAPLPDDPLVSVIVPSFNQGRFIEDTIRSVLSQDYRPVELLVIDGGSTDSTLDVLRRLEGAPGLRWWSEPDRGVADAVNKGLARAGGSIAAIQSSDDLYAPGALRAAVDAFRQRPCLGLVYGDIATVDDRGREDGRSAIGPYSLEGFLARTTWVPQPSAFFRLDLARELGGWSERYFVADTEFWLRLLFRADALKLDRCLALRRRHGAQRDRRTRDIHESYWRMIDDSPDLRHAPRRLRRLARAGACMLTLRYNPTGSDWLATRHLWTAFALCPAAARMAGRSPYWIPGLLPVRRMLSRVKRTLLASRSPRPETPDNPERR